MRLIATLIPTGILAGILAGMTPPCAAQTGLQDRLETVAAEHADLPGMAIWLEGETPQSAAIGQASPEGGRLTAQTPVRIASNTKTYVAAAYLRLWEQGLAPLDDSIAGLIDPDFDALLSADGYDTALITPRHLLMHVSGMPDHADQAYVGRVMADPQRQWTRAEQIALLTENHDPLGPPGEQFRYSDTGYLLLGHIIERITGEPLPAAVRRLLDFEGLGLDQTWWEQFETRPAGAPARAHQYLGGTDTHDWNGSLDLYGGGGLIASPRDMARFMAALFRGEVFDSDETLAVMIEAPGQPALERYRLGVFPGEIAGMAAYSHSGFWGSYAVYIPELDMAVAGVTLDQSGFRALVQTANGAAAEAASR